MKNEIFQKIVYDFYELNARDLPWRRTVDPYCILVSEIMLQQTQAARVIDKYTQWIRRFPSVLELSQAPFNDILPFWTGLGYNRRALYLQRMAIELVQVRRCIFPTSSKALQKLPGVGPYTAAAVCVFAYNQPLPLIETNVRTVMIHHFFKSQQIVSDVELLPIIEKTIDRDNPRKWFNALFDYGSYIKSMYPNPTRQSSTYSKQAPLKGSVREVRGFILKRLAVEPQLSERIVQNYFKDINRVSKAINGLVKDGLIKSEEHKLVLK